MNSASQTGCELITAERQRQIESEGWSADHDRAHGDGGLVLAAVTYALWDQIVSKHAAKYWPWGDEWLKPKDKKQNLIRAGALIAAELDRMEYAERTKLIATPKSP